MIYQITFAGKSFNAQKIQSPLRPFSYELFDRRMGGLDAIRWPNDQDFSEKIDRGETWTGRVWVDGSERRYTVSLTPASRKKLLADSDISQKLKLTDSLLKVDSDIS